MNNFRFSKKTALFNSLFLIVSTLFYSSVAEAAPGNYDPDSISVPLTMVDYQSAPSSLNISVGIGDLPPMPFKFDTGSTGLHAMPLAHLDAKGSGVRCTKEPTETEYGNPVYIKFTGFMCYAKMHFGKYTTEKEVPIANLEKIICTTAGDPRCKMSDWGNGIFGSGLVGLMSGEGNAPNPLLSLPARYRDRYSITTTSSGGTLVLGAAEPSDDAVAFPLTKPSAASEKEGYKWLLGQGCLGVNGDSIHNCPFIVFDSGAGSIGTLQIQTSYIPNSDGYVDAGTRIGVSPVGGDEIGEVINATTASGGQIRYLPPEANGTQIFNMGFRAFLDHTITYDTKNGIIYAVYNKPAN